MIDLSSARTQLVTLAPARVSSSRTFRFRNIHSAGRRYEEFLAKLQRFRGMVYCRDGAIPPEELTPDGRHKLDIDERSWHVLALDQNGEVCGCCRYVPESTAEDFGDRWIREASIANCPTWGSYFRRAIEHERARARQKRFDFAEVGGWAVAEDRHWTTDPLRIILAVCGLAKILGGCVGVATATVRHGSAVILRRIGLLSLVVNGVEVPSYYDPHYGCEMEALRFDTDFPNPKYRKWIEELRNDLEASPVIYKGNRGSEWAASVRVLESPKLPLQFPLAIAG